LLPAVPLGAATPTLRAQRLGWAGVHLQLGDASLFLDPLLDTSIWGDALKEPLTPIVTASGARYVLVSHRHPDHCDQIAIRAALGDSGTLIAAESVGLPTIPGVKMRVAPLHEPQLLGDFTATAMPAADGYGDPQVSWVVSAGGRRIFHGGDTLWHGHWWHIARQLGPFDAAFLPINGARFAWRKPVTDIPAVLTPEQAVAAAVVLDAKLLVPIHYGIVGADSYEETKDPASAIRVAASKRDVAVQVLPSGGWVEWRD
jgi:L-ascorbate metabolism protein UlaG (beta-lactamase superfamily)